MWNLAVEQQSWWWPGRGSAPGGAERQRQLAGARAAEPWLAEGSSSVQQQALGLLYSPVSGAGLTMLRNEISADAGSTIEPTAPASPARASSSRSTISAIGERQMFPRQTRQILYGPDGCRGGGNSGGTGEVTGITPRMPDGE